MKARIDLMRVNPGIVQALLGLERQVRQAGFDSTLLDLVRMRASQINGCAYCLDMHSKDARANGETEQRLYGLSAWREAPYFDDAERAALELAESVTRLSDRGDAVPDEVWSDVAAHYNEEQLASLVLWIATTNLFNRLNAPTRQVAGAAW